MLKLARTLGFPILADPLSGLRHADPGHAFVIASYEALLQADLLDDLTCDLVLRFGVIAGFLSASSSTWRPISIPTDRTFM